MASQKDHEAPGNETQAENMPTGQDLSRRKLLGGAVVMTLASRSAWGQPAPLDCVSEASWLSFTNGAVSLAPGGQAAADLQRQATDDPLLTISQQENGDYCLVSDSDD